MTHIGGGGGVQNPARSEGPGQREPGVRLGREGGPLIFVIYEGKPSIINTMMAKAAKY